MVSYAREIDHRDALEESVWKGMPDSMAAFFVDNRTDHGAFYRRGRLGTVSGVAGVGAEALSARNKEDERFRYRNTILLETFTHTSSYTTLLQMMENFFSRSFQDNLNRRADQVAQRAGIDMNDARVSSEIDQVIEEELGGAQAAIEAAAPADQNDVDGAAQKLAEEHPDAVAALRDRLCELEGHDVCTVPSDSDISLLLLQRVGSGAELAPSPTPSLRNSRAFTP